MYGTPAYFCVYTHTHLLTLTHIAITLSLLCGILATVARNTSVQVPHLALSCRSEGGEAWSGGVNKDADGKN